MQNYADLKQKLTKPLIFGICGAAGGFVGSLGGEIYQGLTDKFCNNSSFILLAICVGAWEAILAIGISIALIAGQNYYLRRRFLSEKEAKAGSIGGLVAGFISGFIAQVIYTPLANVPFEFGRILAWAILGALLGLGMSFFIPNLKKNKALLGGSIGGAVGCVIFIFITMIGGDTFGRLVGTPAIGFAIGVMIALLEILSQDAKLIVEWTTTEKREILLGKRPIVLGSSEEADIYLSKKQGYLPITAKIFQEKTDVIMEFMPEYAQQKGLKIRRHELPNGSRRKLGDVTLEIRK